MSEIEEPVSFSGDASAAVDAFERLQELLKGMFLAELDEAIDAALQPMQKWQGFSGLAGLFDELAPEPPIAWTPWEFKRMWDSLERPSKVNYIRSLMSDL